MVSYYVCLAPAFISCSPLVFRFAFFFLPVISQLFSSACLGLSKMNLLAKHLPSCFHFQYVSAASKL